jgi:hypothetical protein
MLSINSAKEYLMDEMIPSNHQIPTYHGLSWIKQVAGTLWAF